MTEIADRASTRSAAPASPASGETESEPQRKRGDFRGDIEGLRAVAILLIVGFHAAIPGFSGGFIGVDVFFVISGFLITRRLLSDSARLTRVPFGDFWARRIRRLVPGLALMVIVTLLASLVIINPFDMIETAKEGAASALYVSNILFAQATQNYFGSNPNKSPFLHTWSLGVEEQFYVLWPFLVLGLLLLFRRQPYRIRKAALVLFVVLFIVSFALNVVWTNEASPWAFFSLPTRTWEFAAGGFLGTVAIRRTMNPVTLGVIGLIGFGLLVGATEFFDSATRYPGTNALIPVAATVLLILAGGAGSSGPSLPSRLLSIRPMQWTGRLSYSWYLWHWPFIVLTVVALKSGTTAVRTSAALASLGAAYLAFRFVENPIRFARRLARPTYKTFMLGLAITIGALGVAAGTWFYSSERTPASFTHLQYVAAKSFFPGCHIKNAPGGAPYCFGGDISSSSTVALVGDSHSATWFNTISKAATQQHLRVLLLSNPGCPYISVAVRRAPNGPLDPAQCLADKNSGLALLSTVKPTAVVLTQHSAFYLGNIMDASGSTPSEREQVALWRNAFRAFLVNQIASGARVGVILDNPMLPQSPAECVAQTGSITDCEPSRTAALGPGQLLSSAELQVLSRLKSVPYVSPASLLCDASGCPLERHGSLLYVDNNHLTYAATQLLEPQVAALLRSLTNAHQ